MKISLQRPGDCCYEHIEYESKEELVKRLVAENKMKKTEELDDKSSRFFKGKAGEYLLYLLDAGEDSRIYVFYDQKTAEYGLLKLFESDACPISLLVKYRNLTQKVINDTSIINDQLNITTDLNGEEYKVKVRFMMIGEPEEHNGVNGIIITSDTWMRGNDVSGSRCPIESQLYGSMAVGDVSPNENRGKMFTIPFFKWGEMIHFLEGKLTLMIKLQTGADKFFVTDKNVKAQIDRTNKVIYLVITDICDNIRYTYFPDSYR